MMMNVVMLVGRVVRDPDLRYTPQGTAVCRFTLAVDRLRSKNGGGQPADFIDCATWQKTAEVVAEHAAKGRLVGVVGRLETGSYTGKDGARRRRTEVRAHEVRFLDRKPAARDAK